MQQQTLPAELRTVAAMSRWMDTKFRLPGTSFRFGLDGLLGLIPGVGDLSTFAISGYLLILMARNGASGYVLSRMLVNITIDVVIGAIPFIGDLFDFVHKANVKNMRLMEQYYTEGRHRGSAWKVILPVVLAMLLLLAGVVWGIYRLLTWIF